MAAKPGSPKAPFFSGQQKTLRDSVYRQLVRQQRSFRSGSFPDEFGRRRMEKESEVPFHRKLAFATFKHFSAALASRRDGFPNGPLARGSNAGTRDREGLISLKRVRRRLRGGLPRSPNPFRHPVFVKAPGYPKRFQVTAL